MPEIPASSSAEPFCRVALFQGTGRPLELHELPVPQPGAYEALVRIECCTLCGSDLHTINGSRQEAVPSILGHEILGVIEQVGTPPLCDIHEVPLQQGDRVTWSVIISCGECDRCLNGLSQKCRQVAKYGHEVALGRYALSGGLAEFLLLRKGSAVVQVDPHFPAELLCPVNCATATVAAAYRTAGDLSQKRVLIFGAGMLGLTAAAFAKFHRASQVVVCDLSPARLELARRFGADVILLWQDETAAVQQELDLQTGSHFFDVVLELSGSPTAVETAVQLGAIGAKILLVGTVMGSRPVQLDPEQIVRRWLSIHGIHNYAPCDLQTAVDFLTHVQNLYPFASLVGHSFPLSNVNAAVEFARQERPVRVAIRP